MKLTETMWNDFLDNAVDSSGSAGWSWFKEKYGFTFNSFQQLMLENQRKAEILDKLNMANLDEILKEIDEWRI